MYYQPLEFILYLKKGFRSFNTENLGSVKGLQSYQLSKLEVTRKSLPTSPGPSRTPLFLLVKKLKLNELSRTYWGLKIGIYGSQNGVFRKYFTEPFLKNRNFSLKFWIFPRFEPFTFRSWGRRVIHLAMEEGEFRQKKSRFLNLRMKYWK